MRRTLLVIALLAVTFVFGPVASLSAPVLATSADTCGQECPCQEPLERADSHSHECEPGEEDCTEDCADGCSHCGCCRSGAAMMPPFEFAFLAASHTEPIVLVEDEHTSAGRLGVFRPPRTLS